MKDNVYIKVISGSIYPKLIKIDKNILSLGRGKSSDIVIDDKKASRNHAKIISGGGIYKIEDLNSRNGTYVNGLKIAGSKVINFGDSIKIGDNEFILSTQTQKNKVILSNKPLFTALILIILLVPSIAIPTYLYTGNSGINSNDIYVNEVEEAVPVEDYEEILDDEYDEQQLIDDTLGELQGNIEEILSIFSSPEDFVNVRNYQEVLSFLNYIREDLIYSIESLPNFPGKGDILYSVKSILSSFNEISMFLDDNDLIHLGNAAIDLYNALINLNNLLTKFL